MAGWLAVNVPPGPVIQSDGVSLAGRHQLLTRLADVTLLNHLEFPLNCVKSARSD
jgi:hypothetical protein